MSGKFLENYWKFSGKLLENFWKITGKFLQTKTVTSLWRADDATDTQAAVAMPVQR